jgi:predicted MPP superfamily phosphohydrolase
MKILLTADLHCNPDWLGWLEEEATKYGRVCIAGDLLDAFSEVAIQDQVAQVKGFLYRLAAKTRVAVCSGNHDAFELAQPSSPRAETVYAAAWLAELREAPELITDGQTRLVPGQLVITTIPYFSPAGLDGSLIEEGKDLKSTHVVPWLLIVHDPMRVQSAISRARPDFVHFGHYHGPQGYSRRSDSTLFLSAGQRLGTAVPNHIVLDSESGLAVWKYT